MKIPHFFKAHSRIGLQFAPHRMLDLNIGVERGPDYVLSKEFLQRFPASAVDEFDFTPPEEITSEFTTHFCQEMLDFATALKRVKLQKEVPVVVGGDHSVSFASILNTLKNHDARRVGYIHFDSHPDSNLWGESPTHNWHGMYLRPFLTEFDLPEVEKLVPTKLLPENCLFVGNLDMDPSEKRMIDELGIIAIDQQMVVSSPELVKEVIAKILKRVDFLHINFDIDIFDHSLAPATSIPAPSGFDRKSVFLLLAQLRNFSDFALDLVEVNPLKKGGKKTVILAQEILSFMLK